MRIENPNWQKQNIMMVPEGTPMDMWVRFKGETTERLYSKKAASTAMNWDNIKAIEIDDPRLLINGVKATLSTNKRLLLL